MLPAVRRRLAAAAKTVTGTVDRGFEQGTTEGEEPKKISSSPDGVSCTVR